MNLPRNFLGKILFVSLFLSLLAVTNGNATDLTLSISTPSSPPAGSLTISVPASIALGTTTSPSTLVFQMETMTVTDSRGTSAGWTASVIVSALTNSGPSANTIIPSYMSYSSGVISAHGSGSATFVEHDQTDLTSQKSVVTAASASGTYSATWSPTFTLVVPAGATDGSYTGTITHSVA